MKELPITILSPRQFSARHPGFTMGGLRHVLFHRATNGLAESGAVLMCGRKLLIHEQRFLAWVDAVNHFRDEAA